MDKYREVAKELGKVICDLMNLFYKEKAAENFRHQLFLELQEIKFRDGKWRVN